MNKKRIDELKKNLNAFKKDIEEEYDHGGLYKPVLKHLKTGSYAKALKALRVVKMVDGVWRWNTGGVTSDLVERIEVARKNKTKTKKSNDNPVHLELASEIAMIVEETVKKQIAPLIVAMQCTQRHLDVIATQANIDLS